MTISFHCSHCGRKIEAKDSASGKWGTCPACHNKIYVPNSNADQSIKLKPLDKKEEQQKQKLMKETYQLQQDILQQRQPQIENSNFSDARTSTKELTKNIVRCLREMADGNLTKAESLSTTIANQRSKAIEILDHISVSEILLPQLQDIPQQVLAGLIRTLRSKLT